MKNIEFGVIINEKFFINENEDLNNEINTLKIARLDNGKKEKQYIKIIIHLHVYIQRLNKTKEFREKKINRTNRNL